MLTAKQEKDHMTSKADLSCEGWWKRKSTYLFHHIKGVTTVCSVVAAGAVVGFVVMSQRWQQDHWHLHQFQFSASSEVCKAGGGGQRNKLLTVITSRWVFWARVEEKFSASE